MDAGRPVAPADVGRTPLETSLIKQNVTCFSRHEIIVNPDTILTKQVTDKMLLLRYVLCAACAVSCVVCAGDAAQSGLPMYSGYLSTNKSDGSELFYAYYEAQEAMDQASTAPTLLWLQV